MEKMMSLNDTDEYFKEVTRRASMIFQTAFSNPDKIYFVLMSRYNILSKERKAIFGATNAPIEGEWFFEHGFDAKTGEAL